MDNTIIDLAQLYNYEMEVQVNVLQLDGTRFDSEYLGKSYHGYTDGLQKWKPFRIPYLANSNPEYTDTECRFDFDKYVEAIGMTGWNWVKKQSMWVAFDFDSILNHNDALSPDELDEVQNTASKLDWVTIRRSTSGQGIHLYVFIDNLPTTTHTEHAALARAILGLISSETGYNFANKVDVCGGNMWVWHRKQINTNGLQLIKSGRSLKIDEIPKNWKDHISVISGKRKRTRPGFIKENESDDFEKLAGMRSKIKLDDSHKKLIELLKELNANWWWDNDHHMLVTHTYHLLEAHQHGNFKGSFTTLAKGKDRGEDHNCYLFPIRSGGWSVRRYSPGVQETNTWDQDSAGWTRCYFNVIPDLKTVARSYGAVEDPKGGFVFTEAEIAQSALLSLGINIDIPLVARGRKTKVSNHKDGRLIVEIAYMSGHDDPSKFEGWLQKGKYWIYLTGQPIKSEMTKDSEIGSYDDLVRHLISPTNTDCGWLLCSDGNWNHEPYIHIKTALSSMGNTPKEVTTILGDSILKPWKLVSQPFQPEYPGDRQWNKDAAQLKYLPIANVEEATCPTWNLLLNHIGKGLNRYLVNDSWANSNGVITGGDYLRCYVASIIQQPFIPLPYLFLYSPEQKTGKSSFAEALSLIMTKVVEGNNALTNQQGFNGELAGAVVCYIEEYNLNKNKSAYDRIKHWNNSPEIQIHPKGGTPYMAPNTTHWIQTANDHNYCPIFPGDTRIMMLRVAPFEHLIPKFEFRQLLIKEASHFVTIMLNLQLPTIVDRLGLPVIETDEKKQIIETNRDPIHIFITEECELIDGYMVLFSEFCERFKLKNDDNLSNIAIGRSLPTNILKGRWKRNNQVILGNIKFKDTPNTDDKPDKYILDGEHIIPILSKGK